MAGKQKFFEVIRAGTNFPFIEKSRGFMIISLIMVVVSLAMLPINAFVLKDRGKVLNWGVDFRGGTELVINFTRNVEPGDLRRALDQAGFENPDVVRFGQLTGDERKSYLVRLGAVSVVSEDVAKKLEQSLAKTGGATLKKLDWSEGGDKIYLRYDQSPEVETIRKALADTGVDTTQVQAFGRADDHTFEATLIGLDAEVRKALEKNLGAGVVADIPQVESVGAKAGQQLQVDGVQAVLGAILLIVLYVALRFDFRYGPGTIIALLHDAIITIGAFAITYREFSLTTLAAVLTIVGYSVNDTIIVFDRIRENVAKHRDRKFELVVNQSVNETLSRTVLTSSTLLFVTLAMNILGSGVVKDFAFAMNVGVIVGTYSSIFVASPILIWLNRKMMASSQQKAAERAGGRRRRQGQEEPASA